MKKILILVGGGVKHLKPFSKAGDRLGVQVITASFSQLEYSTDDCALKIYGEDLKNFDVIYFRLVGKRLEDAILVAHYAIENKIPLVDRIFARGPLAKAPLKKSLETLLLVRAGIPLPRTIFGSLALLSNKAPQLFGFPFIIKGTYGKQGHAVWLVKDKGGLEEIKGRLESLEKEGKRFLAQEFIKITERTRVFVIGNRAIGSVALPTKWKKYVKGLMGIRETPLRRRLPARLPAGGPPTKWDEYNERNNKFEHVFAVKAAQTLGIDIAGVDIIRDEETGKFYVLEVNSAPRWAKFKKETGTKVEEEILKYLSSL